MLQLFWIFVFSFLLWIWWLDQINFHSFLFILLLWVYSDDFQWIEMLVVSWCGKVSTLGFHQFHQPFKTGAIISKRDKITSTNGNFIYISFSFLCFFFPFSITTFGIVFFIWPDLFALYAPKRSERQHLFSYGKINKCFYWCTYEY